VRSKPQQHREKIRATLLAREQRIRRALQLLDVFERTGIVIGGEL